MKMLTVLSVLILLASSTSLVKAQSDSVNKEIIITKKSFPRLENRNVDVYQEGRLLSQGEVKTLMNPYPKILRQYEKGWNLRTTGYTMLGGGAILALGGMIVMVSSESQVINNSNYYNNSYDPYNYNNTLEPSGTYYIGLMVSTVGGLLIEGGIACTIIGKIKIRQSINNYNSAIASSDLFVPGTIHYAVGMLDNGRMGLKITF